MSQKPKVNEDTLFLLTEAHEKFAEHFGVPIKTHSTLCRYAKGIVIPHTNKVVRLNVVFSPSRARMISLKLWNKFLADLQTEYAHAMEAQDG